MGLRISTSLENGGPSCEGYKRQCLQSQPKGFVDPHYPNHALYLKKPLYGIKQAPRAWYDQLTEYLVINGFSKRQANRTLFIKKVEGKLVVAQVYVDDIIFGSTKDDLAHSFSSMMQTEFEISMIGELNYLLKRQIWQNNSSIFISQTKYANNLVMKFGLESTSLVRTPMSPNVKLTIDLFGKSVDPTLYVSIIGSLIYLTANRPDISYSVGVCAQYQANPKESHVTDVKHIIKYVKSTSNIGVWYDKDTNDVLVGYSNADCVSNADDHKSTSSGCFYLGNNLVSWMIKKKNSISLSIAEAEYIATGSCCTQLFWI